MKDFITEDISFKKILAALKKEANTCILYTFAIYSGFTIGA